ncbi:hypothetical protein BWI75_04910 [Gloeocapsopsis sp. AAB1 = 1H9]|uniref:Calcium-binding protein n=2 Tax=Gloeocapsopsis TaxID=693222 RepID=A0A6N8FUT5_9CHRO|nr:hypothetical protein [Gloeocapsopsis dulcis AAB1 = 1H9]
MNLLRWRRYTNLVLLVFSTVLIISCTALLTPSAQKQVEQARSADAFVDSIGVNVHLTYTDTAYGKYKSIIRPRLQELGIRHIRDGFVRKKPKYYQKLQDLADIGIYSTLIAGIGWVTPQQAVEIAYQLNNSLEAVEGPNEYDVGKKRQQWVQKLRKYMEQLHHEVKSDRQLDRLPIVGPSFVDRDASTAIGKLTQWVDYGNMHPYNYPHKPGDNNIDKEISNRSRPFDDRPLIATEAGYHTGSVNSDRPLTETAHSKYLPRLFLEYFNRGVLRTFAYEFIDQRTKPKNREANFGILRNDGSPKPAFITLKNLIALLNDPGESFPLKSLEYTLAGDTTNIHHTLLQKRDGRFYLILWQEVTSFNPQKHSDRTVPEQSITVNMNMPVNQANLYQVSESIDPIKQTNPKNIKLNIPDYPVVLELLPPINS